MSRRLASLALALVALLSAPIVAATQGPVGAWVPGPPMATPHESHIAVVLKDSRVLIVGLQSEVYDPVANTWSAAGHMAIAHSQGTATLLRDGRVLVTGGIDGTTGRSADS